MDKRDSGGGCGEGLVLAVWFVLWVADAVAVGGVGCLGVAGGGPVRQPVVERINEESRQKGQDGNLTGDGGRLTDNLVQRRIP